MSSGGAGDKECAREDSNVRPTAWKAAALSPWCQRWCQNRHPGAGRLSDGPTAIARTMRALRLFNLGANVLLVTVRTIPVTELRLGSLFDIAFDRLPLLRGIANPFAVRTNRIRDASEQWESIERYVEERSEAQ